MIAWQLTRRSFIRFAGALGLTTVAGCCLPTTGPSNEPLGKGIIVFKRSGRHLRVSNAAKANNANKLYATSQAAAMDLAHPGDTSKVVQVVINRDLYSMLFANGKTMADLRHDL